MDIAESRLKPPLSLLLRYQKHAIDTRPAIYHTISLGNWVNRPKLR